MRPCHVQPRGRGQSTGLGPQPDGRSTDPQPLGCPSLHFSTLSRLLLIMFALDSSSLHLSRPVIPGSGTKLKCPDSHRNLDLRLSLDGDSRKKRLGVGCWRGRDGRWAKTQMRQLCFITPAPLWCLESQPATQCRVEGYAGGIAEPRDGDSGSPQ